MTEDLNQAVMSKFQGEELPDYGRIYFEQVLAEYQLLPKDDANVARTAARAIADKIIAQDKHTWADLYGFEKIVLKLQPIEVVRRRAWDIRAKYHDTAGDQAYDDYVKSNPPDPKTATEPELRADLEQVLAGFHWIYAFTGVREQERNKVTQSVAWFTFIVLVVVALIALVAFFYHGDRKIPMLPFVIAMGMIGGYISLQMRIQNVSTKSDPIVSIFQLSTSRPSVYLSPITGAVFAVILNLMFIGSLLQGVLFPKEVTPKANTVHTTGATQSMVITQEPNVSTEQKQGQQVTVPTETTSGATPTNIATPASTASGGALSIGEFVRNTGPETGADLAKLLVWSFIAGFAERFVPDTIDRLVAKADKQ